MWKVPKIIHVKWHAKILFSMSYTHTHTELGKVPRTVLAFRLHWYFNRPWWGTTRIDSNQFFLLVGIIRFKFFELANYVVLVKNKKLNSFSLFSCSFPSFPSTITLSYCLCLNSCHFPLYLISLWSLLAALDSLVAAPFSLLTYCVRYVVHHS